MATEGSRIAVINEYAQAHGLTLEWLELEPSGLLSDKKFRFEVIMGNFSAEGSGSKKSRAKENAAEELVKILQQQGYMPSGSSQRKSVSVLQEKCQKSGKPLPKYSEINQTGPPNDRTFTFSVTITSPSTGRELCVHGEGKSKKIAKENAAKMMLHNMLNDESNINSLDGIGSQFNVTPSSIGIPVHTFVGDHGNMYESTSRLSSFPTQSQLSPNTRLLPSSQYPPSLGQSTDPQNATGQHIMSRGPPGESVTGTHPGTSIPFSTSWFPDFSSLTATSTSTNTRLLTNAFELPELPSLPSSNSANDHFASDNSRLSGNGTFDIVFPSSIITSADSTHSSHVSPHIGPSEQLGDSSSPKPPIPKPRRKKLESETLEFPPPINSQHLPQPVHVQPSWNIAHSACTSNTTDSNPTSTNYFSIQQLVPPSYSQQPSSTAMLNPVSAIHTATPTVSSSSSFQFGLKHSLALGIPEHVTDVDRFVDQHTPNIGNMELTLMDSVDANNKHVCFASVDSSNTALDEMPITAMGIGDTADLAKTAASVNLKRILTLLT